MNIHYNFAYSVIEHKTIFNETKYWYKVFKECEDFKCDGVFDTRLEAESAAISHIDSIIGVL